MNRDVEECDGADTPSCPEVGFELGATACSSGCLLDTSGCRALRCGDGVVDAPERCDDSNLEPGDGCSVECQIEGDVCAAPIVPQWDGAAGAYVWNGNLAAFFPDYPASCADTRGKADGVASFTAPHDGRFYATVTGSGDPVLFAVKGGCASTEAQVACSDADRPANQETIEFELEEGEFVYVVIADLADPGRSAAFRLEIGEVICGDGIVQGREQCDPGADPADDGCGPNCRFIGNDCGSAFDLNQNGTPDGTWPHWFVESPNHWLWRDSTERFSADRTSQCTAWPTASREAVARFVAPEAGRYYIYGIATFAVEVHALDPACTYSAELACVDLNNVPGPGEVTLWLGSAELSAGEEIYLVVDGRGLQDNVFGEFWLHIDGRFPLCGDGVIDPGEGCDDGNVAGGDGCSAVCTLEFAPHCPAASPTIGAAADLPVGRTCFGALADGRAVFDNYFRFEAIEGTTYRLATGRLNEVVITSLPDTILAVVDSAGNELAQNDDATPGTPTSLLDWTAPADGTYYVRVSAKTPVPSVPFEGYAWTLGSPLHEDPYTIRLEIVP